MTNERTATLAEYERDMAPKEADFSSFREYLVQIGACQDAREWAGDRTAEQAWAECDRADWLLWWAAKEGVDRKLLVRLACQFARTALQFVMPGDQRPLKAIETAEAWCEGKATLEEVRNAADAAYAAASSAAADAAASSAAAASAASYAASSAAYAAGAAASAAYAAAYAAGAVYCSEKWGETRAAKLREFAGTVRQQIAFPGRSHAKRRATCIFR